MFLSCVLHVSHVAMGVKLLLKIKASEMSDLGFHCSAARGGLHSRTVAAGSGAPGKLWAPWLYAGFQEGHWRPSSDTTSSVKAVPELGVPLSFLPYCLLLYFAYFPICADF